MNQELKDYFSKNLNSEAHVWYDGYAIRTNNDPKKESTVYTNALPYHLSFFSFEFLFSFLKDRTNLTIVQEFQDPTTTDIFNILLKYQGGELISYDDLKPSQQIDVLFINGKELFDWKYPSRQQQNALTFFSKCTPFLSNGSYIMVDDSPSHIDFVPLYNTDLNQVKTLVQLGSPIPCRDHYIDIVSITDTRLKKKRGIYESIYSFNF